mgnify:CR=1 FL=1
MGFKHYTHSCKIVESCEENIHYYLIEALFVCCVLIREYVGKLRNVLRLAYWFISVHLIIPTNVVEQ